MPTITYTLPIPLDGSGTEIPTLNTTDSYQMYLITGTAVAIGNYAIVPTGTPNLGMTYFFRYLGTLDITTGSKTFSLFGETISQAQLLKQWDAICYYNGTTWDVVLHMDFAQSAIISSSNLGNLTITNSNIANSTIDACTKLVDLSVCTAKINDLAVTTAKVNDLAITDTKLAADSVITSKILDDNVTNAKLADMADQTIKGNISGGAANPTDIAISTIMNANAWGLTGNSGTIAGTNFIGTTDAVDLVFKVSNIQAGRIGVSGANTSFGALSLVNRTSGTHNTALGEASLFQLTSGSDNTAIGNISGNSITTGSGNVSIGYNNLVTVTTGNNNIAIGKEAGVNAVAASGRIALGFEALADADNQFAIADTITELKAVGITSIKLNSLQAFDDNAAAIVGGLSVGELFVTTGGGAIAQGVVCQVY